MTFSLYLVSCGENSADSIDSSDGSNSIGDADESDTHFVLEKFSFQKVPTRFSTDEELIMRIEEHMDSYKYETHLYLNVKAEESVRGEIEALLGAEEIPYVINSFYVDIKYDELDYEVLKELSHIDGIEQIKICIPIYGADNEAS